MSATKKILIKAEGKSVNNIFSNKLEDLQNEEVKSKEYFDFIYKLNSKDNSIFAIYGKMGYHFPNYHKKVTFECYEQV